MFKKLAEFLLSGVGYARQARATARYCAGSRPSTSPVTTTSHRARRPTLICEWRKRPSSGALACHWLLIDLSEADAFAPRRDPTATQSPTGARARGKQPFTRAAAA